MLALFIVTAIMYGLMLRGVWGDGIGLRRMSPAFSDFRQLLASAACADQGHDVRVDNPCDQAGRIYTYSTPFLQVLRVSALRPPHTYFLGAIFVFLFCFFFARFLFPQNPLIFSLSLLALLSPSVLFGIDRMNLDMIFILLFMGAGASLASRQAWSWSAGLAAVLCMGSIKYYPFAAVPTFWPFLKSRGARNTIVTVSLIWVSVYLAFFPQDIPHFFSSVPKPHTHHLAFGVPNLFYLFHADPTPLGLALVAGFTIAMGWAWARRMRLPDLSPRESFCLLSGASVYLICHFLSTNFEYRRALLLLTIPALLRFVSIGEFFARQTAKLTLTLILLQLWSVFYVKLSGQPVFDIETPTRVAFLTVLAKQILDGWLALLLVAIIRRFLYDRYVRSGPFATGRPES